MARKVRIDLGDTVLDVRLLVKGKRLKLAFAIGPVLESTSKGRPGTQPSYHHQSTYGKVDVFMDLMADKQVALSLEFTDEMGNPQNDEPGDVTVTWSVDDPGLINLSTDTDGRNAVAAAVGGLGNAVVHVDVVANGQSLSGDLAITVVTGLAERVNIVPGEVTESTPDV